MVVCVQGTNTIRYVLLMIIIETANMNRVDIVRSIEFWEIRSKAVNICDIRKCFNNQHVDNNNKKSQRFFPMIFQILLRQEYNDKGPWKAICIQVRFSRFGSRHAASCQRSSL